MSKVRLAVVGVGSMALGHLKNARNIPTVQVTAVCDVNGERVEKVAEENNCKAYTDHKTLLKDRVCDAILIATPHYFHTTVGIDALKSGHHVLVEKPISVHKADCERLIAAHKDKKLVFAAMFNQRTDENYRKIREMILRGDLGAISRISWTITDWFRPNAYYASGQWRATWKGEGGGVLLNQCPHQLDLWQWLFGMPATIRAFCGFGKRHAIEVEDEVTAYMEYDNGATGTFITTTGEAPGVNRLEVAGDQGRLTYEDDRLRFIRNEIPTSEFTKTTRELFSKPPVWNVEIPTKGKGGQHAQVLENFASAILNGTPLIAPAAEGIRSVELANAMVYSAVMGRTLRLPLNGSAYEKWLRGKVRTSEKAKKT